MAYQASSGLKWNRCRSTHSFLILTFVLSLLSLARAHYFVINQPSASSSWANDSPYPFKWIKGLQDGIGSFDVEITRLKADGLYLVAQNVPTTYNSLNILLQDVAAGDDYFVVCLNSTSGLIYSVSSRFSVTNSSAAHNPSPAPNTPTVTISGAPSPTSSFAVTLGPPVSGARSLLFSDWSSLNWHGLSFGGVLVLCTVFLGGVMVF